MTTYSARRFISGGRLSRRRAIGIAATAAAFAVACGGDSSEDQAGSSSGGQGSSGTITPSGPAAQQEGTPKPGGIYHTRFTGNPSGLDPYANTSFRVQEQSALSYSRLFKFKSDNDPTVAYNFEVVPDLAASFEQPGDGTQLVVRLQPNATFHQVAPVNGRAVESEDVRLTLERFRGEPKNTNRAVFGTADNPLITGVETPDAKTVVFKLDKPYGPILNLFANPQYLWIMPKEITAGTVDPSKQIIGSGPFIYDSFQPDIDIKVRKNPNYFVQGRPYVDGRTIAIVAENVQGKSQFQAGRLDAEGISFEDKPEVERSNPKTQWITTIPGTIPYLAFQQRGDSMWRDPRLRQAASILFDRDEMLQLSWNGQGYWHNQVPAHMGKWRLDPQGPEIGDAGKFFKPNPAEAKALMSAAGYPNGIETRFIYTNNAYGERFNQWAEAIAGMLKDGGIRTQITIQDYNREYIVSNGTIFGHFEGMYIGLMTPLTDPHDYLFAYMHSKSGRNAGGINDPQLDAMIDKEGATVDQNERLKLVKDIQRYANERMYYAPGFIGPGFIGIQPWVKGYKYSANYGSYTEAVLDLWLDR
jgi:peptide/nickel transport system substrate-binding protein